MSRNKIVLVELGLGGVLPGITADDVMNSRDEISTRSFLGQGSTSQRSAMADRSTNVVMKAVSEVVVQH